MPMIKSIFYLLMSCWMNGVAKDTQAFSKKKESQFTAKKIIPTGSYVQIKERTIF